MITVTVTPSAALPTESTSLFLSTTHAVPFHVRVSSAKGDALRRRVTKIFGTLGMTGEAELSTLFAVASSHTAPEAGAAPVGLRSHAVPDQERLSVRAGLAWVRVTRSKSCFTFPTAVMADSAWVSAQTLPAMAAVKGFRGPAPPASIATPAGRLPTVMPAIVAVP